MNNVYRNKIVHLKLTHRESLSSMDIRIDTPRELGSHTPIFPRRCCIESHKIKVSSHATGGPWP